MEASISSLCPFVNTHRMVRDYTCEYYTAAHERFRALEANGAARARELAAAMNRICTEWLNVWIGAVQDGPKNNVAVASTIRVHAASRPMKLLACSSLRRERPRTVR